MVRFDLTDFNKNTIVNSAELRLYVEGQPKTGESTVNVHRVLKKWNESEASWYHSEDKAWWDDEGGDYNTEVLDGFSFPANTVYKWHEFDVSSAVQEFIKNPENNFGFYLLLDLSMASIEYSSSESGNVTNRPKLVLNIPVAINDKSVNKSSTVSIIKNRNSIKVLNPLNKECRFVLYSLKGIVLYSVQFNRDKYLHKIDPHMADGSYLVQISTKMSTISKHFTIVK